MKIIDVTITCPITKTAMKKSSHLFENVANVLAASRKELHYKAFLKDNAFACVVPFALETSGRLSSQSENFLDNLFGLSTANPTLNLDTAVLRKDFISRINCILVRSNAMLIRHSQAFGHTSSF